jgi:hypothetical protein
MAAAKKPDAGGGTAKPTTAANVWTLLAITVVMIALVVIVTSVVNKAGELSAESVVSIIAAVVPVFASIGAAVFGVSVAYQKGTEKGKTEAAEDEKLRASQKVSPLAESGQRFMAQILEKGSSPSGTRDVTLQSPQGDVIISGEALEEFQKSLVDARAYIEGCS